MARIGLSGSRRRLGVVCAGAALATATLGLAAMTAGTAGAASRPHTSGPQSGGVIKFAETPGGSPTYIFPETTAAQQSAYNIAQFIPLMYEELFLPSPNAPTEDYAHSIGEQPVWSDNDTVATVTLRHYVWSDGSPVTARDCIFYMKLGMAEGPSWGNYAGPTQFPYNIKSMTAIGDYTLKLVLDAPVNPTFYDDNGIGYITPLPQQAWDKESATGPIGNYDLTPSGAAKVVAFLQKQAADTSTYTTNPLWKVIDGAWSLKSFGGASSPDIFVPNPDYSGPKPYASEFEEIPFTSNAAEFASLRTGTSALSAAFVPTEDIPAIPSLKSLGYSISQAGTWGISYIIPSLTNPEVGGILSQTYIRQVLAYLTDQGGMIKHFMYGYGYPGYGPVPVYPLGNQFVTSAEKNDPYPFSVAKAESILKAHDWTVNPNGTDYCNLGGAKGCGVGVSTDQQLSLNLIYSSGITWITEMMDLLVSDGAEAGVRINASSEPFNTLYSQLGVCNKAAQGTPLCTWQLAFLGLGESTYPSGEGLFNTGGGFNYGGFSNPLENKYIAESTTASTLGPFDAYENLTVAQEADIFMPNADSINATASNLHGYSLFGEFTNITNEYIEPQFWYYSK